MDKQYIREQVRHQIVESINSAVGEVPDILSESEMADLNDVIKAKNLNRAKIFPMAKGNSLKVMYKTDQDNKTQMISITNGEVDYDGPVRQKTEKLVANMIADGFVYIESERKLKRVIRSIGSGLTKSKNILIGAAVTLAGALGMATVGVDFTPSEFIDLSSVGDFFMNSTPVVPEEELTQTIPVPDSVTAAATEGPAVISGYYLENFGGLSEHQVRNMIDLAMEHMGFSEGDAARFIIRAQAAGVDLPQTFYNIIRSSM